MKQRFFPFALSSADRAAAVRVLRPGRVIPFAAEVSGDGTPIDQQLADAFNSNNAVMAYVIGITNSNLPTLSPAPDWYINFATQFADAKIHAMEWLNSVTPGLVGIPTGIANYGLLFNLNMSNINQAMQVLLQDPNNQPAQQTVLNGLQNLLAGLGQQLQSATAFQQTIDDFASQLTADRSVMQTAVQKAEQTQGYDQQQVDQLKRDIDSLQDEISTWQKVVTGAAIGAGVAFWAGAVIAIFSFGVGLAFGIIGAAAGIALLIAAEVKIKQLSAKIAQDQANMTELNQQIATLTILENNLNNLITLSNAASQQFALIIQAWQVLEQEITAVINDLNAAQGDLSKLDLPALQNDLNAANADWQTLRSFCLTIAGIQYNQATPASATLPTTQQPSLVAAA